MHLTRASRVGIAGLYGISEGRLTELAEPSRACG